MAGLCRGYSCSITRILVGTTKGTGAYHTMKTACVRAGKLQ